MIPRTLLAILYIALSGLSACEPDLKPFDARYTTHGPDGPPNDLSFNCREDDCLQLWSDGRYQVTFRRYSTWSNRLYVWEESGSYRFDEIRSFPSSDGPTLHGAYWIFTPMSGKPWSAQTSIAHPYGCDLSVDHNPLPGRTYDDPIQAEEWRPEGPYRLCLPE